MQKYLSQKVKNGEVNLGEFEIDQGANEPKLLVRGYVYKLNNTMFGIHKAKRKEYVVSLLPCGFRVAWFRFLVTAIEFCKEIYRYETMWKRANNNPTKKLPMIFINKLLETRTKFESKEGR